MAELRQRVSVVEARLAALDKPPPPEWDDGCLTGVQAAVASARLFRTLDELVLGAGGGSGAGHDDRFACVSDLTRRNLPAVARAQDAAKRAGTTARDARVGAPTAQPQHIWDPSWSTRRTATYGCWDVTHKRWETDDAHRPQDSELNCQTWCRANPCTYKRQGDGRPEFAAAPKLTTLVAGAGLQLGGALACLVTDVRLRGAGRGFGLRCRSLGLRPIELDLPAQVGAQGGALATLNLGDLVRVKSYGRIAAAADGGPWVVSDIAAPGVSVAERSSCCADPASLAAPSK